MFLIELAQRRLALDRDVQTAIVALEAADARLAALRDQAFAPVRQQIARELQALRAVRQPDTVGILARLTSAEEQAARLPIKGILATEQRTADRSELPEGMLARAWAMARNTLANLIVVRKVDDTSGQHRDYRRGAGAPSALAIAALRGSLGSRRGTTRPRIAQRSPARDDGSATTSSCRARPHRHCWSRSSNSSPSTSIRSCRISPDRDERCNGCCRRARVRSEVAAMKGGLYIAVAAVLGALLANLLLARSRLRSAALRRPADRDVGRHVPAAADRRLLRRPTGHSRHQRAATLAAAIRSSVDSNVRVAASAQGLLELSEGEYEAAEKTLTRYVRDAENPVAHYLVAARAADLQGAAPRRDEWLARALEASTDRRAPVLIMQAEIHLKHKQLAIRAGDARTTGSERRIERARAVAACASASSDGRLADACWQLEPRLRSTRGIPPAVADETVAQIYLDRLKAAGAAADLVAAANRRGRIFRSR